MECRFRRIGAVQRLRAKTTTNNAAENGNAATGRVHPKSLGGTSMSPSKRGALLFPLKICGEIITSVKENGAQIPRHSSSSYLQVHFYLTPARALSAFSPRLQFVLWEVLKSTRSKFCIECSKFPQKRSGAAYWAFVSGGYQSTSYWMLRPCSAQLVRTPSLVWCSHPTTHRARRFHH